MKGDELKAILKGWFNGADKTVIVGVGNPLRRDDNVGMDIVRRLRDRVPKSVHLIESETVPENALQKIVDLKPSHVLVVDAAIMNLNPGEAELVHPGGITGHAISTHSLPLRIFLNYIKENAESKVALLAIQPKETDFGEGLTEDLKRASKGLAHILLDILCR